MTSSPYSIPLHSSVPKRVQAVQIGHRVAYVVHFVRMRNFDPSDTDLYVASRYIQSFYSGLGQRIPCESSVSVCNIPTTIVACAEAICFRALGSSRDG